jgi:SAM-dependent methyltransferase
MAVSDLNKFMASTYLFAIESSNTPIYSRIIDNFRKTLLQIGHQVLVLDLSKFATIEEIKAFFEDRSVDYCLITNPVGLLSQYIKSENLFLFEYLTTKLIFIHHDNLMSEAHGNIINITDKLNAFRKSADKSYHFCLEYSNFLDLRSLGIDRVYPIFHASEFDLLPKQSSLYDYDVSFVGHVLPCLGDNFSDLPYSHHLRADFWNRLVNLDTSIEKSAISLARQLQQTESITPDFLACKYYYLSLLHTHSQFFRGELIRRIDTKQIDVIGGDPAYLHGHDRSLKIDKSNIRYHSAVSNYHSTQAIYNSSKINLNITSLQFDRAVINRVIDVGAAGGFILTDWKDDLSKVTSVANEIAYRSIEELNYKIEYYLNPHHENERTEIAHILHQDIRHRCSYDKTVKYILDQLDSSTSGKNVKPVQIDLGCGPWKSPGFIGVDIAPCPGVDIVADLSQRFPFADNSVDVVRAHDVIEHLEHRIHTMNEIWRICKPNALVDIRVPSTDGRGAFQDPTHVSFWNINSFNYYCVEYPNYLKLSHIYGFKGKFWIENLSQETSHDGGVFVIAKLRAIKENEIELLSDNNFIVFPNWLENEEILIEEITDTCYHLSCRYDREKPNLLIDTTNVEDLDSANLLISSVAMNLMMSAEIDITERLEVSLTGKLTPVQWKMLLPKLRGKIQLASEDRQAIELSGANQLPQIQLSGDPVLA